MDLPRYVMFFGTTFTLALAIAAGCGDAGTTGSGGGTSSSGGPMDLATICKGVFSDQGSTCGDCLAKSCALQEANCCKNTNCEPIAKCARGKQCTGMDCYLTPGEDGGPCHSLIDDFGGPTGDGNKAAIALTECTNTNCMGLCTK